MTLLQKWFTGKRSWLRAMAFFVVYMGITVVALDPQNPVGRYFVGNLNMAAGVPDLAFGYTPRDLSGIFDAYGPVGRSDYRRNLYLLDVVMPLMATLTMLFLFGWYCRRIANRWAPFTLLLPLAAFLCDMGENVCLHTLVGQHPHLPQGLVGFASLLTSGKWLCLYASYIFALAGGIWVAGIALVRRRHRMRNK